VAGARSTPATESLPKDPWGVVSIEAV
jgi:hypothetical protein